MPRANILTQEEAEKLPLAIPLRPKQFKDRAGDTTGNLTPIRPVRDDKGRLCWLCSCSCGSFVVVLSDNVGETSSCGCLCPSNSDLNRYRELVDDESRTQASNETNKKRFQRMRVEQGLDPNTPISDFLQVLYGILVPLKQAIKGRDEFTCVICCKRYNSKNLHVHHIAPRQHSRPTSWCDPSNLITLCRDCHIDKVHEGNFHGIPSNFWIGWLTVIAREREDGNTTSASLVRQTSTQIDFLLHHKKPYSQKHRELTTTEFQLGATA